MWVLMTKGAVSIVQFNHAPEGDPKTMQVRSRRKEWISAFARYVDRPVKLIHSDDKDYQWRFFATPDECATAVGKAVLDISYSNFKNATSAPGTGLRSVALRNGLHTAYHKIWNTLLDAGDGTSVYNGNSKGWTDKQAGAGTIAICARMGHWYHGGPKCADCGSKQPASCHTTQGAKATKEEVAAWWAAHPEKKRVAASQSTKSNWDPNAYDKQQSAKQDSGVFATTCNGSGLHAAKGSMGAGSKTGSYTGRCTVCGEREALAIDTWAIMVHDKPVVELELPAPSPSLEELEANRDAAKDYYLTVEELNNRGEGTDDDVDDAITAYCEAEDAYLKATGVDPATVKENA